MAEPINLNLIRKARAKADAKAQAVENRVRFGRTRVERQGGARDAALTQRRLEAHRREPEER